MYSGCHQKVFLKEAGRYCETIPEVIWKYSSNLEVFWMSCGSILEVCWTPGSSLEGFWMQSGGIPEVFWK